MIGITGTLVFVQLTYRFLSSEIGPKVVRYIIESLRHSFVASKPLPDAETGTAAFALAEVALDAEVGVEAAILGRPVGDAEFA